MKFGKWLDNFWYHHKWKTIIIVFLVAVITVCAVQLIEKEEYDACVMYVGDASISGTQYQDILTSMRALCEDFSGDGKTVVNFSRLKYITDEKDPFYSETNASAKEHLASMVVMPYYIYIMPTKLYDVYKGSGVFQPLDEIFTDGKIPGEIYDGSAIYFDSTYFAKNCAGGEGFAEDTVIALKVVPYNHSKRAAAKEQKLRDANAELFKNIVGN